jgi:hypothetical protein
MIDFPCPSYVREVRCEQASIDIALDRLIYGDPSPDDNLHHFGVET